MNCTISLCWQSSLTFGFKLWILKLKFKTDCVQKTHKGNKTVLRRNALKFSMFF